FATWRWRATSAGAPETSVPLTPGARRVAVLYFDNQSGSRDFAWLRQGLADMVITDLSRFDQVVVLSRLQLDVLLQRQRFDGDRPIGLEQALAIGRDAKAEAIVLGAFAAIGNTVRFETQIVDARTGRVLGADSAVADRPDQILTQVDLLALRL